MALSEHQKRDWRTGIKGAALISALFITNPIAAYFTLVASSVLINAFFPPKGEKRQNSETYSWQHKANKTADNDTPMAILYGTTKVKPIIKNRFIVTDGNKQYLYVLYSLLGHRIDEYGEEDDVHEWSPSRLYSDGIIVKLSESHGDVPAEPGKTYRSTVGDGQFTVEIPSDDANDWIVWHGTSKIPQIFINGNPISDYINGNTERIKYDTRPGLSEQSIIDWFDQTYENYPQNITLGDQESITVRTTSLFTQNIEVVIFFPDGLYRVNSNGTIGKLSTWIFIQYREIGTEQWFGMEDGEWHKNRDYGDDRSVTVYADRPQPFYRVYKAKKTGVYLDSGKQYEVRILNGNTDTNDAQIRTLNVASVSTIQYAQPDADGLLRGYTYPGEVLIGMKILASGELSRDIEVTAVATRSTVKVWTGLAWIDKPANNHAWAAYDILANGHPDHPEYPDIDAVSSTIQPIYGCGIDKNRIDSLSFLNWANMIDDLGWEYNSVFDSFQTAWDAILRICREGRGVVYPIGSKFFALPDKAVDSSDIQQLFCEGNINRNTFQQAWVDASTKANEIEVTFFDEDNNYVQTSFILRTSDWDDTAIKDPIRLYLYGTTAYNQAFALARYFLNNNELLSHSVIFECDTEALQSDVGDVIPVQHDSMTGQGGRITGYNASTRVLSLDKTITLVAGTEYEIYVWLSNGQLERKVVEGNGDFTTITFGGGITWSKDPQKYDVWAFGEVGLSTKLFRIMDIDMSNDYKRVLTCLEYDAKVYQTDLNSADTASETAAKVAAGKYAPAADMSIINVGKIAPDLNLSDAESFNTALALTLKEVLSLNRTTGEYESSVVVTWNGEDALAWGEWDIRWRDVDVSDLGWQGVWAPGTYSDGDKVINSDGAFISIEDNNTSEPFIGGG